MAAPTDVGLDPEPLARLQSDLESDVFRNLHAVLVIRNGKLAKVNEEAFIHRSLKPLDEVAFKVDDPNQIDMFGNECEGMCGV